ncbi:HTH-type transcriptional repressor YvoA [Rubripirellula amarantea]|uniref:HTH-type transcriptional repressor YvoA n=1 Tax=Rubripirellula amarantea TaxID=2527999 RepID=A0A5C5WQE2_9BACT|nr:GntR family transcriptional regulator [Rubripirellula amarantea]TWT52757.1 HTH-type transcriptional repressor YvoA [Rubripirellula amarantea]
MDKNLRQSPVYQRLNERLRASLHSEYQGGDKFMSERQISEQYSVSRATANKALASLVSEGVLEFRRGVGTFVRCDLNHYNLRSLVSFTEKANAANRKPSTQILSFESVVGNQVDELVTQALNATDHSQLWEMKRLRLADHVPVILEHRYVIAEHCPGMTKTQVKGSLYQAFTKTFGLSIAGADDIIRSVSLTTNEARILETTSRAPALEVISVGFIRKGTPLWWERTLYRGDQYEFHSRLGPIQTATPARGQLR